MSRFETFEKDTLLTELENSKEVEENLDSRAIRRNIYVVIASIVLLWVSAILAFGLPGLYIPAVCFVPVMFAILIYISRG